MIGRKDRPQERLYFSWIEKNIKKIPPLSKGRENETLQ